MYSESQKDASLLSYISLSGRESLFICTFLVEPRDLALRLDCHNGTLK